MGLNRASLMFFMAIAFVASYSTVEVSCTRLGPPKSTNSTSDGGWGWGWGWGRPSYNYSSGPSYNFTSGPSYNFSGGPGDCPTTRNHTHGGSNKITVGGSNRWNFGFNYSDWAMKTAPFYLNDVLVFKYDPPSNGSHPHSVYLLPDWWSYQNCDLRRAKRLAAPTQGNGKGFEYKLRKWQPYYFACGESNGFHCKTGMMKFFVVPVFHWSR